MKRRTRNQLELDERRWRRHAKAVEKDRARLQELLNRSHEVQRGLFDLLREERAKFKQSNSDLGILNAERRKLQQQLATAERKLRAQELRGLNGAS